uniref:Uncharacterized protein n=1 Tax=Vespula pensylvanica TaxID=30213 RepID=A0A834PA68_VESPE|nr:hypothetical protein H0235_002543 [Vespula pensylvanica]
MNKRLFLRQNVILELTFVAIIAIIANKKEIHLELIKCAMNINDAYGLHILFSILSATILITVASYNMYLFFMAMDYREQAHLNFTFFYWIFHCAIKIVIISYVCARTVTEVIQNPLIFTTNGFFDLGYTLMRNVLGTVTTFLIILIQVGNVVRPVLIENSTLSTNNYSEN